MVSLKELVSGDYDEALQIKAEIDKIDELLSILNPKSEDYDAWKNKRDILQKKYDEAKKRTTKESLKEVNQAQFNAAMQTATVLKKQGKSEQEIVKQLVSLYNLDSGDAIDMARNAESYKESSAEDIISKKYFGGKKYDDLNSDDQYKFDSLMQKQLRSEATISLTQARDQLADSMFDKKRYADCTPENKAKIDAELKLKGIEAVISQDDENTFKVEALDDNFSKGFDIEKSEHPTLDDEAIKNLVMDHLEENPNYYDKEEGETLYPKEAEGDGPDEEWKILVADPQKTEKYARTPDEMAQFLFKKNYAQCTPDEKKEVQVELNDLQKELGEGYKKEYNEDDFERNPIQKCLDCGNQFQGNDNDKCSKCGSRNISKKESLKEGSYAKKIVDKNGKWIGGGDKVITPSGKVGYVYQIQNDEIRVTAQPQTGLIGWFKANELELKESLKEEGRSLELTAKKMFNKSYDELNDQQKKQVDDEVMLDLWMGL